MIADLAFGRADAAGVRPARFVPRASIPIAAACLVANGLRETLRELFGERCELTHRRTRGDRTRGLGTALARRSLLCDVRTANGHRVRRSNARDARALVLRAFGEGERPAPRCSVRLNCTPSNGSPRAAPERSTRCVPSGAEHRSARLPERYRLAWHTLTFVSSCRSHSESVSASCANCPIPVLPERFRRHCWRTFPSMCESSSAAGRSMSHGC